MSNEQEFAVPTASTSVSATNILHLNDDCLREIFSSKCLSIFDLCSIVETDSRLEEVLVGGFPKQFKKIDVKLGDLRSNEQEKRNTRRILSNFGPLISELLIFGDLYDFSEYSREFDLMLDWVTAYCSNPLELIKLSKVEITKGRTKKLAALFGTLQKISLESCIVCSGKTLFSNCESLVDLELRNIRFNDQLNALTNTFAKLERFGYSYCRDYADFFSDSIGNSFFSRHQNLKALSLSRAYGISHLLPIVADNSKQLAELNIWIEGNENGQDVLDIDVVRVIKRLINLKTLHLDAWSFKMHQKTYLRIVDVVRGRPGRFPDALQIKCRTANDGSENSFRDANCRKIVKIN